MQTIENQDILGALATIAELCPWEAVDIWIRREPEGKLRFTAHLAGNYKFGLDGDFCNGETLEELIKDVRNTAPKRDPEAKRKAKILELELQLQKLRAVIVGMPPYRPGFHLGPGTPPEPKPARVNTPIDI